MSRIARFLLVGMTIVATAGVRADMSKEKILKGADERIVQNRTAERALKLVGPDGDPRIMLRVLARLARLVKHSIFLDKLRGAETSTELRAVFSQLD